MYHSFESAKVGDKVLISYGWDSLRVATVDKVTKLHVLVGGAKYQIRTGSQVGSGAWGRNHVRPFVQSEWDEYKQEAADKATYRALTDFKWSSLDIETARKIQSMIAQSAKEPKWT